MKKTTLLILAAGMLILGYSCNSAPEKSSGNANETPAAQEEQRAAEKPAEAKQPTQSVKAPAEKPRTPDVQTEQNHSEEAFPYLKKYVISEKSSVFIKHKADISETLNIKQIDIPVSGPYHDEVIKTQINQSSGEEYYVLFSWGPSADPEYIFYRKGRLEKPAFRLMAPQVFIPGNGNIYTAGHSNNTFDTRKKYIFSNNSIREVEQPFYYVGMQTQTRKPVVLYKSQKMQQKVAGLPADYAIEVVLNKKRSNFYLIKTQFGLTGWLKVNHRGPQVEEIKNMTFAGD